MAQEYYPIDLPGKMLYDKIGEESFNKHKDDTDDGGNQKYSTLSTF